MAENKICPTCGHVNNLDAQFCQMCFTSLSGPGPKVCPRCGRSYNASLGGCPNCSTGSDYKICPKCNTEYDASLSGCPNCKKPVWPLIVGIAVEVLAVAALIAVFVFVLPPQADTSGSTTPTPTPTPTTTQPVQSAPAITWNADLENYIDSVAPVGNGAQDLTSQLADEYAEADYSTVKNYSDFATYNTGNAVLGDVSYPKSLFCRVVERPNCGEDTSDGYLRYQITFAGNDGTLLKYECFETPAGSLKTIKGDIFRNESERLSTDEKVNQTQNIYGNDTDYRLLITGTDPNTAPYFNNDSLIVQELYRMDGNYIRKMTFRYPYTYEFDDLIERQYVAECLVRLCPFSGDSVPFRSYDEFESLLVTQ